MLSTSLDVRPPPLSSSSTTGNRPGNKTRRSIDARLHRIFIIQCSHQSSPTSVVSDCRNFSWQAELWHKPLERKKIPVLTSSMRNLLLLGNILLNIWVIKLYNINQSASSIWRSLQSRESSKCPSRYTGKGYISEGFKVFSHSYLMSSFSQLCQEDQVALLKGGCIELMVLRWTNSVPR